MYPSLYHFFYDVFGVELNFLKAINSFGFFVAVAFVIGIYLMSREMRRKETLGLFLPEKRKIIVGKPASATELALNGLLGFVFGYKLLYAFLHSEVFSDFPGFLFSKEGNIVGGIVFAAILAYWKYYEAKKQQLDKPVEKEIDFHAHEHTGTILILAVIWGIVGAKLFAFLENVNQPIGEFLADPFRGLTMYGGLICATIAITFYLKRKKLPVLHVYDAAAPALIMAYGVGRIGCQVSGDGDWGIENTAPKPDWMSFLPDWMWSYTYPNNVNGDGDKIIEGCVYDPKYCHELDVPVFPTPFYETVMCLMIFAVLWYFRKKIMAPGALFALFLFFNGIERLLIEQIRVNKPYEGISLNQAEIISICLIVIGAAGFFLLLNTYKKRLST